MWGGGYSSTGQPLLASGSGGGSTTTYRYDDGSTMTVNSSGDVVSTTDINGMMLTVGAAGIAGLIWPGSGVPVGSMTAAAYAALPGALGGVGTYDSAAGPGRAGPQSLPPSLPPAP
jgi:hypothetical protein